tara:strand:- start:141 stop:683 length:543 start_codon:yes stop_codon:yes gene_type:complete
MTDTTQVTPEVTIHTTTEEWKSEKIDKLAQALTKAQAEIKGAQVKSTNPFYNSSYADLHTVMESCLPALTKHGLSVLQGNRFCTATNGFYVTTTLLHESGQWVRSEIRMPIGGKKDAHAIGSACTYGRRYGLSAITGVAQHDDDGNSAVTHSVTKAHAENLKIETAPHHKPNNKQEGVVL